jgi:Cep192 domain 4/HYDIN/CFA65/VesB-like, Ig-like domain
MRILPQKTERLTLALIVALGLTFPLGNSAAAATGSRRHVGSGPATGAGKLAWSPSRLSYGTVAVGQSKILVVTLRNSGSATVTVSSFTAPLSTFSVLSPQFPATISPGRSLTVQLSFAPTSAGTSSGYVQVNSTASDPVIYIAVAGTGSASAAGSGTGKLSASPTSISFGSVQVGGTESVYDSLQNTGTASLTISSSTMSESSSFRLSGLSLPMTLAAGQSVTFTTTFAPTSTGSATANLAVTSGVSNLTIPLSGNGTSAGQLAVLPTTANFGTIDVGSTKSVSGQITASGSSVVISSAGTNSSEFLLSGISLPLTLAAGNSTSFTLTFKPQTSGAATSTASFLSNAANSPATVALSGSSTAAASEPHSVSLTWSPSTSSVIGYYVYRGTISGGPYAKLNSTVNTSTTYDDASVLSGQTYYYVVTAADSTGEESAYSAQVQAVIP